MGLDVVPDVDRERARAVTDRELQEGAAVLLRARLRGADEQHLIELLTIGEVADEHGPNGGTKAGRFTRLAHMLASLPRERI